MKSPNATYQELSESGMVLTAPDARNRAACYASGMWGKQQPQALGDYMRLLEEFIARRLYEILNTVFYAAGAFWGDSSIAPTGVLDEDGFRADEGPPPAGSELPYSVAGDFRSLTFDEVALIVASHFSSERQPPIPT